MACKKRKKGEVSVGEIKGSLRLIWTYRGKRHFFRPGLSDSTENRVYAEALARRIELDCKSGNFDTTLDRYRINSSAKKTNAKASGKKTATVLALFNSFYNRRMASLAEGTKNKYKALRNQLKRHFGETDAEISFEQALSFRDWMTERLEPSTCRDKLAILRAAWNWGIKEELVKRNFWEDLKIKPKPRKKPKPFSLQEARAILMEFRKNRPYYAPFVEFLLTTGVRTGEAIALEWGDLSPECDRVLIRRSFNSSTGELKVVKTEEEERLFLLPDNLVETLSSLPRGGEESLVFPAKKGGYLSARNFARRHWKPVLERLDINYRKPYNSRHSVISHSLDRGMTVVEVAELVGNSPRTILERYAGQVRKVKAPDLFSQISSGEADYPSPSDRSQQD